MTRDHLDANYGNRPREEFSREGSQNRMSCHIPISNQIGSLRMSTLVQGFLEEMVMSTDRAIAGFDGPLELSEKEVRVLTGLVSLGSGDNQTSSV